VHEVFFQVFDKGWMEDGQGTRIDFKNTVILLTSNVGSDTILQQCAKPERPAPEQIRDAIRPELLEAFPAALLGRMVVIPYYPLSDEMLGSIVELQLNRISKRVRERYQVPFEYDASVVQLITKRCTEVESGGRMIDAVLTNTLLPEISRELLLRTLDGRPISVVRVSARENVFEYAFD
jgi:type VI secretion system protein VasG